MHNTSVDHVCVGTSQRDEASHCRLPLVHHCVSYNLGIYTFFKDSNGVLLWSTARVLPQFSAYLFNIRNHICLMTNTALDRTSTVRRKPLLNPPFPPLSCFLLSSLVFHLISFLPQILGKTLVFSSFSLHPSLPPRRLAQSLSSCEKTNTDNPGALLACDRGLAGRFKWEHMEIITARWHMHELPCVSGKRHGKMRDERAYTAESSPKTDPKSDLPASVPLDWSIHDVVTHLYLDLQYHSTTTHTSKHTCVMRGAKASPLSRVVLERFFAASVIIARTIKTHWGSQLRGKENSSKNVSVQSGQTKRKLDAS